MNTPILVVMAAGMGSRYGGLKQMDPVGGCGEVIMDYSLYDAKRAGFKKVVFVIKRSMEEAFRAQIGERVSRHMEVAYAFQDMDDLPEGFAVPDGRTKPWGTAHAVLAARDYIDAPFAVINADDYYGVGAFGQIYDYLTTHGDDGKYRYCMVGYQVKNTVTENGSVSRGVCTADAGGHLVSVVERTRIEKYEGGIRYFDDAKSDWTDLAPDTTVSMNLWGFSESFIRETYDRFPAFLTTALATDPQKAEYYLPTVVTQLLSEDKATVKILPCSDKWYGVTYKEDKPELVQALSNLTASKTYPSPLWK